MFWHSAVPRIHILYCPSRGLNLKQVLQYECAMSKCYSGSSDSHLVFIKRTEYVYESRQMDIGISSSEDCEQLQQL